MGYVITGGAGLLLGVALLIWALRERGLRAKAEKEATQATVDLGIVRQAAAASADTAKDAEENVKRLEGQVTTLRQRLGEARQRLIEAEDPKAIKAWLDEELDAAEL